MKAYSLDLRERMLAARQAGATQVQVAALFRVSVSFVAKLAHRQRTSGHVAARPGGRGSAPGPGPTAALAGLPAPDPGRHARRAAYLVGRTRRARSEPFGAGPGRAGAWLAAKKKSVHATERDTQRVRTLGSDFLEAVQA